MGQYIIRRLMQAVPVIWGVLTISFILMFAAPGDPVLAMVGDYYDDNTIEQLRTELGLDKSVIVQYGLYLKRVCRGDLGTSFQTGRPVADDLRQKIPYTAQLAGAAMFLAVALGIFLGLVAAIRRGGIFDRVSVFISMAGVSAPVFWIALLLILGVGVHLQWLPPTGYGGLKYLVLPAIALGSRSIAMLTRTTRAFFLDVLNEDYMRTARAKGLAPRVVILKHGLRNLAIPLITIVGLDFGSYLSGAVLTESIFGWPGVGRFALSAIMKRDFPAIQGSVLMMAVIFIFINILVDILYAWADPRVRKVLIDE